MSGPACSATRCIGCRRSASCRRGLWLASGFGGHGLNTTAMAGNILAQAIVEGDDTWRLFAPFELVWAGGRIGRAAMQVYYWWFDARERFEARQARQREQEYRRVAELAALRAGEEGSDVEATLGAVVPREELPEEPTLAELPADPADDPVEAPNNGLARADLPDLPFAEDAGGRAQGRPADRVRTKPTF